MLVATTVGFAQPAKPRDQARHGDATSRLRGGEAAGAARRTSSRAGRWNIGVKCDVPPFGYIDVRGNNAGFDVEVAKWFSRYAFGKRHERELPLRAHRGA